MGKVSPAAFLEHFEKALKEGWGYIWGYSGSKFTQSEYNKIVANPNAKNREATVQYGMQWIGKRCVDCSGLFVYSAKQCGEYMPHSSQSIWDKCLSDKGELYKGKRTDGQELKVGTAVFVYDASVKNPYKHIGIWDGKQVIEAQGTKEGVVNSKITKRWTHWGELKILDYSNGSPQIVIQVKETNTMLTGYINAPQVNLRSAPSKSASRLAYLNFGDMVQAERYNDTWAKVVTDKYTGYVMSEFISSSVEDGSVPSTDFNVDGPVAAADENIVVLTLDKETVKALSAALKDAGY